MRLSVGIITLNEARRIQRTLEAVCGWAGQIVVVDAGSTDGTQEICRQLGAEVLHQDWLGYGAQKNVVIDHCQGDWILLIDADEVVTPPLRDEIKRTLASPVAEVYEIPLVHILFGRRIRHGGWEVDRRPRLFRRGAGRFADVPVHEGLITDRPIGQLDEHLDHYSYLDFDQYLGKLNRYTTLEAQVAVDQGRRPRFFHSLFVGSHYFIRRYVSLRGFRDGRAGLLLSLFSALHVLAVELKVEDIYQGRLKKLYHPVHARRWLDFPARGWLDFPNLSGCSPPRSCRCGTSIRYGPNRIIFSI